MVNRLELQNMDHTIKNNIPYTGFAYNEEQGAGKILKTRH
jgi:hypothetical protein